MTKKIKLIDDTAINTMTDINTVGSMTEEDVKAAMKYLEAIDWKLWEMLKILRNESEKE